MTEEIRECDFLVVGAGIAGASAASALAPHGKTCLIEREALPGYHSTGRSAAIFLETYGNATVRGLTRASRAFFEAPPKGFAETALTSPRGALFLADEESLPLLRSHYESLAAITTTARWMQGDELAALCPCLDPTLWVAGIFEADALDINVHALHQGFLRQFRRQGGCLSVDTEIVEGERVGGWWRVRTSQGGFRARWIIDAAGAWADLVAIRLGVRPLCLSPKRRTVITVDAPENAAAWPYVGDIADTFYFKPEAGRFLASPCDETDSPPCDVQPEEFDVASIAERLQTATGMQVQRIHARWAGLRTFAADRTPVAGVAKDAGNFFWLAGQGGYGIQTSPAMAETCRTLIVDGRLTERLAGFDISPAALSPVRLGG